MPMEAVAPNDEVFPPEGEAAAEGAAPKTVAVAPGAAPVLPLQPSWDTRGG